MIEWLMTVMRIRTVILWIKKKLAERKAKKKLAAKKKAAKERDPYTYD